MSCYSAGWGKNRADQTAQGNNTKAAICRQEACEAAPGNYQLLTVQQAYVQCCISAVQICKIAGQHDSVATQLKAF